MGIRYLFNICSSVLYPKMTQFPELLNPEVVNVNVRFPCKINYPKGEPGVTFTVMWNVDGHVLLDPNTKTSLVTTLTGDQRIAYLDARKRWNMCGNLTNFNYISFDSTGDRLRYPPPLEVIIIPPRQDLDQR
jgi:hypothetical protein